ncbi:glycosyltransferase [Corynebacterium felinum]|uniref:Cellulose synthase/poly-beta-1,6-N-acetylglucosamine synthase-like glycosyltransferase n=1 Tax=Corynebacterium felinum TaxID=131318 RepID=A0ABU2BCV6_9CORY|nr:glycosyltransferase [Corynebacterium felinum]MDF5819710.1 glycosyltransferase [Corynebacterium felinum]MDR7355573.1 cellulose synthase/poly-beta-1,6-N-acetylglucosamine synthase-like glycosyltransferase [Corynebacterium felinum]WJY94923.1 putative glycosyl transferase [Corynebacterium felinum]
MNSENTVDMSIIVCTSGKQPLFAHAVASVARAVQHAATQGVVAEIIIVDNSSHGRVASTPGLVPVLNSTIPIRVVRAELYGLSRARNVGVLHARGEYVAFTDDDTFVDQSWVYALREGFSRPEIWCVTGRTLATSTALTVEQWFEQGCSFDKGADSVEWSKDAAHTIGEKVTAVELPMVYPYPAGCFGSGNNMAFRRSALSRIGGFAEELGAGRATRGGEDLHAFRSVILQGGMIAYRAQARASHRHRQSRWALSKQMFGYGSGMSASLCRAVFDDPKALVFIGKNVPRGLAVVLSRRRDRATTVLDASAPRYPRTLVAAELCGYLAGIPLWVATMLADRRARRQSAGVGAGHGEG